MQPRVHSREVEEQLAEALPLVGAAALQQALAGLQALLAACPSSVYQKLIIWLWTEGYERFGSVSFGQDGLGLRLWLPDSDGDLVVALGGSELRVEIGANTVTQGRYAVAMSVIQHNARLAAASLLGHLEKVEARRRRKASPAPRRD